MSMGPVVLLCDAIIAINIGVCQCTERSCERNGGKGAQDRIEWRMAVSEEWLW
jgi:hypothetical protein